jgi:hypothetical protein
VVTQCAWCKRVSLGPWYVHLPRVNGIVHSWSLRLGFGISLRLRASHGVCPECAARVYEVARSRRVVEHSHRVGELAI